MKRDMFGAIWKDGLSMYGIGVTGKELSENYQSISISQATDANQLKKKKKKKALGPMVLKLGSLGFCGEPAKGRRCPR